MALFRFRSPLRTPSNSIHIPNYAAAGQNVSLYSSSSTDTVNWSYAYYTWIRTTAKRCRIFVPFYLTFMHTVGNALIDYGVQLWDTSDTVLLTAHTQFSICLPTANQWFGIQFIGQFNMATSPPQKIKAWVVYGPQTPGTLSYGEPSSTGALGAFVAGRVS
jgi:hypothetical protein